jgi:hypothetical protein
MKIDPDPNSTDPSEIEALIARLGGASFAKATRSRSAGFCDYCCG